MVIVGCGHPFTYTTHLVTNVRFGEAGSGVEFHSRGPLWAASDMAKDGIGGKRTFAALCIENCFADKA